MTLGLAARRMFVEGQSRVWTSPAPFLQGLIRPRLIITIMMMTMMMKVMMVVDKDDDDDEAI